MGARRDGNSQWLTATPTQAPGPERFLGGDVNPLAIRVKVIINCAMSADGKIALKSRKQTEISNEADKKRVHELRSSVDAVLVGVGTVLTDDPKLTVKEKYVRDARNPVRIVLDSKGRTPPDSMVLNGEARTIIVTSEDCSVELPNAEVLRCGIGRVDIARLVSMLEEKGIGSVLVEGGAEVIWSFLRSRLADELYLFIGSIVIGGDTSPTPAGGEGAASVEEAVELRLMKAEVIGNGVLLKYEVTK
ncbi:MAG: 2,5-diamino-6-(ribosylamino)-4(3H)-pyrimidinone 5'-phosphate reductase [Methanobacteriota archaeon]|nr:MAG: 2,5-diamino-6-(ribosylamino)-4(3H)-pyrimidinone 5'-phosphate reductase [Euryarchaeota archaeon]